MTQKKLFFWLKLSLIHFLLVAFLGVLMRYKILFSLPFLDQKHLQEAHSHFAFYGWISQILYLFIIHYLQNFLAKSKTKKYHILLCINMVSAYLMIPTFLFGGYFWGSIVASTICLLVGIAFFIFLLVDCRNHTNILKKWFLGGLFFSTISSVGVVGLSFLMISNTVDQELYLASQYYYLHFQYNGFFLFSCIGFLFWMLKKANITVPEKEQLLIFYTLFFGTLFGFGLSVLWMKMPGWIFYLIVLASLSQTFASIRLYQQIHKNWSDFTKNFTQLERNMLLIAGFAFFVKIVLQLGSTIPAINQFAFGFRNIVIAYLHLVLLMFISIFMVLQLLQQKIFAANNHFYFATKLLILGIVLNEVFLGIMGIFSIKYVVIPYSNFGLLLVSILIFTSLGIMVAMYKFREQ